METFISLLAFCERNPTVSAGLNNYVYIYSAYDCVGYAGYFIFVILK